MAVTAEESTQVANYNTTVPPVHMAPHDWGGKLRFFRFTFTQGAAAGDVASTQALVRLPGGKIRVILPLSRIAFSAFGAARTLDLGWQAYTDDNGDAVAADPNGLDDGVDVSSAGSVIPSGTVGGDETYLFESQAGVIIESQCNDDTIPAAATLKGHIAAVIE